MNIALEVKTFFVRHRNVLLAEGNFKPLFDQVEAHWQHFGLQWDEESARLFRNSLAAFALHCASRPQNEVVGWTINLQRPLVNLFLTGDTETGALTGRLFEDHVKVSERNSFYQELAKGNQAIARSFVDFTGADPLLAVERFYEQSEQRPARVFQLADERFAMVTAHPDYDEGWFTHLDLHTCQEAAHDETLTLIQRRGIGWHCGCDERKILEVLKPVMRSDEEALFGEEDAIIVNCPRCAARYSITREALEAYIMEDAPE